MKWLFASFTFGTALLIGLLFGLLPQELGNLHDYFSISNADFGMLAGVTTLLSIALGCSVIWAIPRFGIFRVCLIGYALFALGLAGIAVSPSSSIAMLPALLLAWGMAYLHQGNALAVQLNPENPASTTNALQGFNLLGKALGVPFALVGATWQEPFLLLAGIAVLLACIGWPSRPSKPKKRLEQKTEEEPARKALRRPIFWVSAFGFFVMAGMDIIIVLWLPKFIQERHAQPELGRSTAAFAASVMLWTACIVRFAAPILLKRISAPALFYLCVLGIFGLFIGTEWNEWNSALGIGGMLLCGLALSTPRPTLYALACSVMPRHTGLLALAVGGAHSLAVLIFLLLTGWLADEYGLVWALRIAPMLAFLGMLACVPLVVALRRKRRTVDGTTDEH